MIYIYYDNLTFKREIEYTFRLLFGVLGINIQFIKCDEINTYKENKYIIINYSNHILKNDNVVNIIPSNLFGNDYLDIKSMPNRPLKRYCEYPVIYTNYDEEPYVNLKDKSIVTNIDIIQSTFFMVTRYEEILLYDDTNKDVYGRILAKESLAYKENFLNIPIVNEYIEWLWKWICFLKSNYRRKNYWNNYDFAACLTHDVDMPFKYYYPIKKDIKKLKNQNFKKVYKDILMHCLTNIDYKNDPYFTFNYIRNVEKRHEFNSSFYFMGGGNFKYENFYDINDIRIKNLIEHLENDNCEIGYHYSFNAYNNLKTMKREKSNLTTVFSRKILGGRNHYLRFKIPESWRICKDANIFYDTTLAYPDHEGFRCGICFPYKPFDIIKKEEIDIIEMPLVLMDGTLFEKEYRGLSPKEAIDASKKIIDTVRKYNGVVTILWHNSFFDSTRYKGWDNVFEEIMNYLYIKNCLGESGENILKLI